MATSGLYGSTSTGTVAPQSGSESVGLYGNNTVFGGSYFEWLIFLDSVSTPATPTGGSWSFVTNTGTPPTGWSNTPPQTPTGKVWISIALVNSKSTATLTWSTPGIFANPAGTGTVTSVAALTLTTAGTDVSSTVANPTISPVITLNLPTASATNRGALSAADWTTFNSKGSGTVTSVTGTSPVVSSGGTTPAISMAAATTSTNGYLTSTDWNTFNNKGSGTVTSVSGTAGRVTSTGGTTPVIDLASGVATAGTTGSSALVPVITVDTYGRVTSITTAANPQGTVTSVTGTAPVVSSGGTTPAISMAAATSSTNGYLTSTDWTTFNSKGSGSVTSVAATVPSFLSVSGSPITSAGTLAISYSGTALPVANGGTGVTTSTGTGNNVLSTSPSLTTPIQVTYEDWTSIAAPTYAEGRLWYDSSAHALAYYNDAASAVAHIGHDLQVKVINNTGSTIANGAPVYITGTSSGQTYPNIALAKADLAATASVIGLTNGAIANGAFGYVTSTGTIDNVNTSTYTVGQILYLSPYSAGQLMNTLPPTGLAVQVGVVEYVNASAGKIYVKQTTPLSIPASILSGTVAIANGGTGQSTASSGFNALSPITTTGDLIIGNGSNSATRLGIGSNGYVLTSNGTTASWAASTGGVTSVTGTSPVVSSGGSTPAISLAASYGDTQNPYASKTANYVLAAPNGTAGVPTFRAIVAADIPTLNQNTTGTASNVTGTVAIANGGTGATTAQTAINALVSNVSNRRFLRGDNTNATMSLIQAADVPTLNQDTTGTAAKATNIAGGASLQIPYNTGTDATSFIAAPTIGSTYLQYTGTGFAWAAAAGVGTVTSVAATVPSFLSISGSPITTAGTLAISYSGTALPIANGGTALTTTPTNGQLLIGNGTGYTLSTLTAGSNITITNASGGITIASTGGGSGITTGKSIAMALIFGY